MLNLDTSAPTPPIYHAESFDGVDTIAVSDASWIRAAVKCVDGAGPPCQPEDGVFVSAMGLRSSTVTLVDRLTPVVESASGQATAESLWSGSESLAFSATDRGGGIYRMLVEVDGQVVKTLSAVTDDRCVDRTGARDFGSPVPCPGQASGNVSINAADLPSGQHTVAVYLEDAAGNRAPLIPPTPKFIVNDYRAVGYYANGMFFNPRFAMPRVANGAGAISGARLTASFVRQVGKRARHSVRGRSARCASRRARRSGARSPLRPASRSPTRRCSSASSPRVSSGASTARSARTPRGDFVYRPAARHPNRQLRAVYFPFSDSHESVASDPLTMRVRAGLILHVDRHRLHNGQRLIFTGRVLGPLPAEGIAVTLQAKVGRHYRSFRQLRASSRSDGRIRTAYRFERTTGPVRYRFRLKVVRQAGLPFQSGASPVVSVSVRP